MGKLLEIKNLSFKYKDSKKMTLKNISLDIFEGDFVLLCGETGSGKTTLLKNIKREIAPEGFIEGEINYLCDGNDLISINIGYLSQNIEEQIVTDNVHSEISFILESKGEDSATIKRKIGEICTFFGIEDLIDKKTDELSGGEKQIISLAGLIVGSPRLLLLDEPTAHLDPISRNRFYDIIRKINRELGTTIFICEHNLDEVMEDAKFIAFIKDGEILKKGSAREIGEVLISNKSSVLYNMPLSYRIWLSLKKKNRNKRPAISVLEGKKLIEDYLREEVFFPIEKTEQKEAYKDISLSIKDLYFRYNKESRDIHRGISLIVKKGECYAIVGENGSGKTTLFKEILGELKPYRGKISLKGKALILPQNIESFFRYDEVKKEIEEEIINKRIDKKKRSLFDKFMDENNNEDKLSSDKAMIEMIEKTKNFFKERDLLNVNPLHLSGGEKQILGIVKLYINNPDIYLIDEPTKGIDGRMREVIKEAINIGKNYGKTVILSTHDLEFAASVSDKIGLLFNGELVGEGTVEEFFRINDIYTTQGRKISRDYTDNIITDSELIEAISGKRDYIKSLLAFKENEEKN